MSNEHARALLARIGAQGKMTGRDKLVVGKHRLAVLEFARKTSKKNPHNTEGRYQASFIVVESNVYSPGQKCSVAFFVERSNFPEYEFDRAHQFIDAVAACTNDTRGTAAAGEDMLDPTKNAARGVVLDVVVTGDVNEDGSAKKGKKGNQYTSELWTPLAQTPEMVAAARAELDKTNPLETATAAATPAQPQWGQPAPQAQQPQGAAWGQPAQPQSQPAPAAASTSLLGRR